MADSGSDSVIRAAGALVWRPGSRGPEIALIHRPTYDDWTYPKGKSLRDEHILATAIREVQEETGLRVVLGRPLTPSTYRVNGGLKRVSYWSAHCAESQPFEPNGEVDLVAWLPAAQARARLTYERDVALLDELRSAPVRTVPLILLRHAPAGRKAAGPRAAAVAGDLARPLDGRGTAEAKLLAGLLPAYGQCRVVSSPAERCVATVRPYAAAAGVPVEVEAAFTVPSTAESAADDLLGLAGRRAAALAASGAPTLACAHRENLPVLIDAACAALGARPPPPRPLRKSAFLVLQSAGGVLVSTERHELAE